MMYFLVYLFLEVMLTSEFIALFGGFIFFLEIVLSAIVGGFLIINFQYAIGEKLYSLIKSELDGSDVVATGVVSLVGAIFLIIPGVLTDIMGILMQFEFIAIFVKNIAIKRGYIRIKTDNSKKEKRSSIDEVIDVELVEDSADTLCNK